VVFPVVGQALVERAVLLRLDVLGIACPDRLRLVELLVSRLRLLDLLSLLFLGLVILVLDFFDLGLLLVLLYFLLFFILNFLKNQGLARKDKRLKQSNQPSQPP
jgi:hypothetical protein